MSRYTDRQKSISWAWGYDESTEEFYFQKFDDRLYDEEEDDRVFWIL